MSEALPGVDLPRLALRQSGRAVGWNASTVGAKYATLQALMRYAVDTGSDAAALEAAAKMCDRQAELLGLDPAMMRDNLTALEQLLGVERAAAQKMCRQQPPLLYADPVTMRDKLQALERAAAQKMCRQAPSMLARASATLANNLEALEELLEVDRAAAQMICRRQPGDAVRCTGDAGQLGRDPGVGGARWHKRASRGGWLPRAAFSQQPEPPRQVGELDGTLCRDSQLEPRHAQPKPPVHSVCCSRMRSTATRACRRWLRCPAGRRA